MRKSCCLQGIIHLGYFDIVFIQHTYINNIRQMSSLLHLGSTVKHFDVVLRIGLAFERGKLFICFTALICGTKFDTSLHCINIVSIAS